jgi:hypothetical protein
MLRVRRGANDPTPEKFTVTTPPEYHGGSQDPHRDVAPVKKTFYGIGSRHYANHDV